MSVPKHFCPHWEDSGRARNTPSLTVARQFLQRSRVLSLWRDILRDCRRIADPAQRQETRQLVRAEFERSKHVTDLVRIRVLLLAHILQIINEASFFFISRRH